MSIQSSINQMLGNVGLLANTFQFQNQIKKTEEISSRFGNLNKERERLEADKAKYQAEFDEERAKLKKDRSEFENYANITMRDIKDAWEGVTPPDKLDPHEVDLWGLNPYAAGNAMASTIATQRVQSEQEKRKSQMENLQKAFKNIGMGGVNNG